MTLFLVEAELTAAGAERAAALLESVAAHIGESGGALIEAQIPASRARIFVIFEADDCAALVLEASDDLGVQQFSDPVPVRLIGATVDEIRQRGAEAGYLVEWDIPEEITMEQYLAAKQAKTPLYDQVDDVQFLRTYVREDTQKCLCFYDAASADAVRRAREVVSTPISRLHELAPASIVARRAYGAAYRAPQPVMRGM
jgi:hypothetical protein